MKEKAIPTGLFSYALLLSMVFWTGCELPADFDRKNPNDAGSINYLPSNEGLQRVEHVVIDRNIVQLTWPQIFGVTRYEIRRKKSTSSQYNLIHETESFKDTAWTDQVLEADVYQYRVDAIARSDSSLKLESELVLSGFVNNLDLKFDKSGGFAVRSSAFGMSISEKEFLLYHPQNFSRKPVFSLLDLESGTWELKEFENLTAIRNISHQSDISPVGNNAFFSVNRFNQEQNFIGILCEIHKGICTEIGQELVDATKNLEMARFAQLQNGKLLFTVRTKFSPLRNAAYILDPKTRAITGINPPLDDMVPFTLNTLKNGNVIGCLKTTQCQVYDAEQQNWSYVAPSPFLREEHAFNSLTLSNGSVAFLDGFDNEDARVQLYFPDSDSWEELPRTKYPTHDIHYNRFVHPIQQPGENQLMVLTEMNEVRYRSFEYSLEIYDFEKESWSKVFRLPDYVEYIYNLIEIEPGAYLITYDTGNYGEEEYGSPKSALFYTE
ncbi:hypothetical protein [Gracilimonas sp.]|uniref:hypothetical protein n=1 Tax=Gracilimonas sp. TaxID=1974203 RepID=UPI0032EE4FB5